MSEMNESHGKTVIIRRTFSAPIKLVWDTWTNAKHIAHWWGPKGMATKILEHDFKVGGKWKYAMEMPDGNQFISEGVYKEIIEQKIIISSADFKPMTQGVEIHALFEKNGDQTNFTFKVIHPTEEYRIQQEQMGIYNGWGSVFDRLGDYLSNS